MGLLGQGWDDPQSSAIMQLAGGLLSSNFGQGAAAYGATMAGASDAAMKRSLLQSQIDENASQNEARKLAGIKDARQQKLMETMMNGDGNPEAISPGAFSPSADGRGPVIPLSAPQAHQAQQGVQGGLMGYARSIGVPEKAIQVDMATNGGKGIAEMLFKRGAPNMKVANGYAYDENTLGAGYLPSLSTSQDGKTSMVQIGRDGLPVVSAPRGAMETFGGYQGAQASFKPIKVYNPETQREEFTNEGAVVGGQPGALPNSATTPGSWKAANPGANIMSPRPGESDQQQIYAKALTQAQQQLTLARTPEDEARAKSDIVGIQGAMKQAGIAAPPLRAGGNFAAGPSATEAATAEANKTRMVDSSKAGTARVMTGFDNARTAAESITSNVEARNSLSGGVFVGAGAETKLAISKSLLAMGFNVAPDKVGNSEYLQSTLGQGILSKAKTLGANPTDNDARIIKSIVGSIGTEPGALNKLLDYQDVMSKRAINDHNANYNEAKSRGFDAGFDLTVKPPGGPDKPDAKPPGKMVDALPTANGGNKGQRIRDTTTGKILVSNGLQWKAE